LENHQICAFLLTSRENAIGGSWGGRQVFARSGSVGKQGWGVNRVDSVLAERWSRWLKQPYSTQNRQICRGSWPPPTPQPSGHHRLVLHWEIQCATREGSSLTFHEMLSAYSSHRRQEIFLIHQARREIL